VLGGLTPAETTISLANHNWEALFDRLIAFRESELPKLGFTIQVSTLCNKIPNFIEKASRAGIRRVFMGLENIKIRQPDWG
jgi:hypothetical protein